jgi:hypothetical protein
MQAPDDTSALTRERRQSTRLPLDNPVRLHIDCDAFEGHAENISHTDLLFYTRGDLPVTVEIEGDGIVKRVSGHLVRLRRDEDGGSSWAVEFRE